MRTLKFKAWDTKAKKFIEHVPAREYMLDSDEWSHHDMDELGGIHPMNTFWHYSFNGRIQFYQFTGFLDSDGTLIFDNDIVIWPDDAHLKPRVVLWDVDGGYWRLTGDSFDGFDDLALSMNGGSPEGKQGFNGPIKVVGSYLETPDYPNLVKP